MSKERISGSEALMRSLEHEGVKTILDIREEPSCRFSMHYTIIGIN